MKNKTEDCFILFWGIVDYLAIIKSRMVSKFCYKVKDKKGSERKRERDEAYLFASIY